MSTSTRLTIRCPECGSEEFSYPRKDELQAEDVATCTSCGRAFTVQALRDHARQQVTDALAQTFGKAFKPRK